MGFSLIMKCVSGVHLVFLKNFHFREGGFPGWIVDTRFDMIAFCYVLTFTFQINSCGILFFSVQPIVVDYRF